MNTCGKCIHKPFCQSPGPVCSSFKDQERFADRDEVVREVAERLCEGRVSNDPVVIAAKALLEEMTDKHGRK